MNPHFYSLLMQSFLSGYEKPCEIKLPFMAIPILLSAESREKLVNANRRSRIDTLFQSPQIIDERKISGKTRLSGYIDRYNSLKPYCKEAIIILSSEGKIAFNNHKIVLIKQGDLYASAANIHNSCFHLFFLPFSNNIFSILLFLTKIYRQIGQNAQLVRQKEGKRM